MPRKNPDPNQVFESLGHGYVLHRSWGSWYPMKKTKQGGLSFLNEPRHKHDGSKTSAMRIIAEHRASDRKQNPNSHTVIPSKFTAAKVRQVRGRIQILLP